MSSPASSRTEPPAELDVLALIDHFALGGAETLLTRFALAAPRAGIRLRIGCLENRDGNPAAAPLVARGEAPRCLNFVKRPGLSDLKAVRDLIAETGPQLVHTHLGTSDLLGGIAARSLGVPVVSTVHTTHWGRSPRERLFRSISRRCAARVIAVSESARRAAVDAWCDEDRVVVIHNGMDVQAQAGAGAEVRAELGLAGDDLVVAMVSALRPEKAHEVAIEAVRLLVPRFGRLRLLIVGAGSAAESIAAVAAPLGDRVVMTGARSDVMRILDAADVCLHPSRHEALPTTIIEAMAASTPIVATDAGGIPEIVTGSDLGVLVPAPPRAEELAAALGALLDDPARREALGTAGRAAYEARFTADPWLRATRAVYEEVLAERRRPWELRWRRTARAVGSARP